MNNWLNIFSVWCWSLRSGSFVFDKYTNMHRQEIKLKCYGCRLNTSTDQIKRCVSTSELKPNCLNQMLKFLIPSQPLKAVYFEGSHHWLMGVWKHFSFYIRVRVIRSDRGLWKGIKLFPKSIYYLQLFPLYSALEIHTYTHTLMRSHSQCLKL